MKKALVLIDVQNDYFPGGAMELEGSEKAGAAVGLLLEAFRQGHLPVIHIRHVATRPDSMFFLPGTEGVKIHTSSTPKDGEAVFTKHFPSSFRDTPLKKHLEERDISQLVLAGMMTHLCVDTTVRAAFDLGFTCTLAHDACATKALTFDGKTVAADQVQLAYLAALDGLFAEVRSAQDICTGIVAI